MQNAVDPNSSTLRAIILYLLILISTLFLYDLFFHVTHTNSNFVCVSAFRKPFTKPNLNHIPNGYQIAKDRAFN